MTEEQEQLVQAKKTEQEEDLRAVMSTAPGRRVLMRLIYETGRAQARSFVAGDQHATAYNEGRRDVGLSLGEECNRVSPAKYAQMHQDLFFQAMETAIRLRAAQDAAEE